MDLKNASRAKKKKREYRSEGSRFLILNQRKGQELRIGEIKERERKEITENKN